MRVTLAQLNPRLGDIDGNLGLISDAIDRALSEGADLIVFPELVLTGYAPRDLLFFPDFREKIAEGISKLLELSHLKEIHILVGAPLWVPEKQQFTNSMLGLYKGDMAYVQHKTLLPYYDIFDDRRYFCPSPNGASCWAIHGRRVGVLICEDAWADLEPYRYAVDPLVDTMALGVDLLVVAMASPYEVGKPETRRQHFQSIARTYACPVVMVNQVGAHDDVIFDGNSLVVAKDGRVQQQGVAFAPALLTVSLGSDERPVLASQTEESRLAEIYEALVFTLKEYVRKTGFSDVVLGLSGGIDSALAAAIAVDALGADRVTGVAMPSRYSSPESLTDAVALAKTLGIAFKVLPISEIHQMYESLLPEVFGTGLAAENIQPRIRGNLLMGLTNAQQSLLLSTGNKSEIAMGYCTLYGDMCGAFCVLGDVYKTEVFALARWRNRDGVLIPQNTLDKPPSAELRPNQTDQDSLPPYEILDGILQAYLDARQPKANIDAAYGEPLVRSVLTQFHRNEYKRRQAAIIPRLRKTAFGTGYRMPVVGMMP
jgi:NAD+ synthase (glutamine-hydrolysing)